MKVVEVIPIVRGLNRASLSYFTKDEFSAGSFVRIPVRKSKVLGLVTASQDVSEVKSSLRTSSFELRKLIGVERAGMLTEGFVEAARQTARFYAASLGSILGVLIPKVVREHPELLPSVSSLKRSHHEPLLIALPDNERMQEYRGLIRERFARGESVLFVVPTREDALKARDELSPGIESYVYTTARASAKGIIKILTAVKDEPHPILFITTPAFLFFDRADLSTIVFERENSRAYRTLRKPFLHPRTFVLYLARESGKMLVLGDSVLSLETLLQEREGAYTEFSPIAWRLKHEVPIRIVDQRRKNNLRNEGGEDFRIFSKQLLALLAQAVGAEKKIFLFGLRKGLAPSTVCGHCGSLLLCKNCGAPMSLHEKRERNEREFRCHHCLAKRDALTTCDNCHSWKLVPLGIGVDRIVEEVARLYPDYPIFVLDRDHAATPAQAREVIKNFSEVRGGILVGTELALNYLTRVPLTAVVSFDSLFSIPDFSINERIFYLLSRLAGITREEVLVQTRNSRESILVHARDGNLLGFYREEVKERQELSYPPFAIFIKVTCEGTREELQKIAARLLVSFAHWQPYFLERSGSAPDNRTLAMILRLPRKEWPVERVVSQLLLLPPQFSIKVDPESIL